MWSLATCDKIFWVGLATPLQGTRGVCSCIWSPVLKRIPLCFFKHMLLIIAYRLHLFVFKFQMHCLPSSESALGIENCRCGDINMKDMWKMLQQEWKNLDRGRTRKRYNYRAGGPTCIIKVPGTKKNTVLYWTAGSYAFMPSWNWTITAKD